MKTVSLDSQVAPVAPADSAAAQLTTCALWLCDRGLLELIAAAAARDLWPTDAALAAGSGPGAHTHTEPRRAAMRLL